MPLIAYETTPVTRKMRIYCRARTLRQPTRYSEEGKPVKFVQRLPRSLHATLQARVTVEGVSLNTLVLTLIAEGLERHGGSSKTSKQQKTA